jgi:hypothetical protein
MSLEHLYRPGVYVFLALGTGVVKIGYSESVHRRLTYGLRGPAGEKLVWLADIRGGRNVEVFMHDQFASQRLWSRREWFYLNDEILEFVREARGNWRLSDTLCLREAIQDENHWRNLKDAAYYLAWRPSAPTQPSTAGATRDGESL